ncbi:MAG: hypothetical protein GY788_27840, partial [bacterium]|nr:hypothetical protein [bacterium]
DTINGAGSSDTYLYSRGDGNDTITETHNNGSADRLVFADINPADVSFAHSGDDLVITISETTPGAGDGGTVLIAETLNSTFSRGVELIEFADGTNLSIADISIIIGDQDPVALQINGTDGDDSLVGTNEDETFNGGAGDDTLAGGYGHDTYIYGIGSGNDIIDEHNSSSAFDVLQFVGLNQAEVTFSRSATDITDVIVTINSSGETVTLDNQLNQKDGVEKIVFADGSILGANDWSLDGLLYGMAPILGTEGDDTLTGDDSDDLFDGGAGNDTLAGGYGHDTYLFGVGSGHDVVNEHSSSSAFDILQLVGLNQSDVTFTRSMSNINDFIVTINATGETITLDDQFSQKDGIEKIIFDDGSILGADDWSLDTLLAGTAPITGTSGDDTINGTSGNELFDGGAGNDTLAGSYGHDTYLFGVGSGHDVVDEHSSSSGIDVLQLVGLNQSDVTFSRPAANINDFVVTINATGETITLDDQFSLKDGIEKIVFEDGTVLGADDWSLDAQLLALAPITGTNGDDTVSGSSSSELLSGGAGNDTLTGGSGNDTFIFASNFGQDTITDFTAGAATDDVIEFNAVSGFASYADILANAADDGSDTTITLDADNTIVLNNVLVSDLSTDDFRFV